MVVFALYLFIIVLLRKNIISGHFCIMIMRIILLIFVHYGKIDFDFNFFFIYFIFVVKYDFFERFTHRCFMFLAPL